MDVGGAGKRVNGCGRGRKAGEWMWEVAEKLVNSWEWAGKWVNGWERGPKREVNGCGKEPEGCNRKLGSGSWIAFDFCT